jgi:hypothetical protein
VCIASCIISSLGVYSSIKIVKIMMKICEIFLKYMTLHFYKNYGFDKVNKLLDINSDSFDNINLHLFLPWNLYYERIDNNLGNSNYNFFKIHRSLAIRMLQVCNGIHILSTVPKIVVENSDYVSENNDLTSKPDLEVVEKKYEIKKKREIKYDDNDYIDNEDTSLDFDESNAKDKFRIMNNTSLKGVNINFFGEDMDKWYYLINFFLFVLLASHFYH